MRSMSFQDLFVKPVEPTRLPRPRRCCRPVRPSTGSAARRPRAQSTLSWTTPATAVKMEPNFIPGAEQGTDTELRLATPTSAKRKEQSEAVDATAPKRKKRKARICKEPDCDKYVVDHGLCIRHGGCNCRAQNRGLCWKHGGYTICKVEGCSKRAKSRGICWSHGGGTRCKYDGCSKIAVSLGRCWAHGGGKRCSIETCRKPASERTNNFCTDHYAWYSHT
ncbi:hypothetical protein GQ600_1775 [Phytophthora cactorum]|nr:hypothetical protein GQ600_1775 [Phytophthora cactorum]